ncbi:MAG: DUF3160 domain-containing protein [Chloroflexi bacterium]|nr:DUF3160 domain-containing protein [Chloroflexota bacterium]
MTKAKLAFLLLPLLACTWAGGGGATAVPIPPPSPTAAALAPLVGEPLELPPAPPWPFVAYQPIPLPQPAAPLPTPNLATAVNLASLPPLTPAELDTLSQTGQLPLGQPSADRLEPWRWAAEQNLPLYVNSDLVLLAAQSATQRAWARAQAEYLPSHLLTLTAAHSQAAEAQWRTATAADPPDALLVEAAERNLAYFGVAGRLLNPTYSVHPAALSWVESELALIAQGGTFVSPLLGVVADYQPLTRAEAGYGRALAWYRQMPLQLNSALPTARLHAQQARLWLAQSPTTQAQWLNLATGLAYTNGWQGTPLPHWQAIATATAAMPLDSFLLTAGQLPDPTFYFLPPPSSPTAEIFHALTYNRVGTYTGTEPWPSVAAETDAGVVRLLPTGLDVAAAVGSETALATLRASGAADFVGWEEQMARLRGQWGGDNPDLLTQTASGGWLYALQPVLDTPTWAVGWAAEAAVWPAIPPAAPAALPEVATVIVAPEVALYGRVAAHQRQLLAQWQAVGWLSEGNAAELLLLDELLRWLFALAVRQQAGGVFTAEEQAWARAIPARMAYLLGEVSLPVTGTLYTDPLTGQVVTAEWGTVRPWLVLASAEGQGVVAVGILDCGLRILNCGLPD